MLVICTDDLYLVHYPINKDFKWVETLSQEFIKNCNADSDIDDT